MNKVVSGVWWKSTNQNECQGASGYYSTPRMDHFRRSSNYKLKHSVGIHVSRSLHDSKAMQAMGDSSPKCSQSPINATVEKRTWTQDDDSQEHTPSKQQKAAQDSNKFESCPWRAGENTCDKSMQTLQTVKDTQHDDASTQKEEPKPTPSTGALSYHKNK